MHLNFLFFAILFFLIGNGCKKDSGIKPTGPITISGQAVDKNKGTPVSNAEVNLIERDGGVFGGGSSQTLQRMHADSNGKFIFHNVTVNPEKTYTVLGYKKLYFNDGNNTVIVNINNPGSVIIPMQPVAWLKLHVKNTAPFDKYDYLSISSPWGGGAGPFVGQNIDTFIFTQVFGNENSRLVAFVTKNNIKSIIEKYITCPAFDTTSFQIPY